jgi:hypothetical protein
VHDPVHVEFWEAMAQVAEHELAEARRQVRRPDVASLPMHPSMTFQVCSHGSKR